jgi:hypothetical protein
MKNLSFIMVIIGIIITTSMNAQTTLEEYNFISKGYRFTQENGLDMKVDYIMKPLKTYQYTSTIVNISGLFRTKNGDLAGYLFAIKDGVLEKDICVPTEQSDSLVWRKYEISLQGLPIPILRNHTIVLSKFLSQKPNNIIAILEPTDSLESTLTFDKEEGTGGIVIPKTGNPLLPSNITGITHHTVRFAPESPKTGKILSGSIRLEICVNKEGEIIESKVLNEGTDIKDVDVLELIMANVHKYKFSMNVYAPEKDCGYLTYTFVETEEATNDKN